MLSLFFTTMKTFYLSCITALIITASCNDIVKVEEHIPEPEDAIYDEFQLGRVLFYDKQLSADNSVSCGSCHKQEFGFADNVKLSPGVNGRMTSRNSMPIQNISIDNSIVFDSMNMTEDTIGPTPLFWDGREMDLQQMVLMPFTDHNEHGLRDVNELVKKVENLDYYRKAFDRVYGSQVTSELIAQSISMFVLSIQTSQTRLDEFMITGEGLTELELQGLDLFFEKYDCNSCHQVDNPSGYLAVNNGGFADIGLDENPEDEGRFRTTGVSADIGKFKIPSLRNVALTAPYMHDGRFANLDSVIEHYSDKMRRSPNLDQQLMDEQGNPLVLNITIEERDALVAFLHTLTDEIVVSDPQFADPFKEN